MTRRIGYTSDVPAFSPLLEPGQDRRTLGRYSIPEAAFSLRIPTRTMRRWFLGKRRLFKPAYHRGDTVFLSFNDLTEAYIIEVLRNHYDYSPAKIRGVVDGLRRITRAEHPLVTRELYAIPEFQNLVHVRRRVGRKEYVDLAHNDNLVFEQFVDSLGRRIERDKRGHARRLFPWKESDTDESPFSIDPEVVSGELVISGTRIPAHVVLGMSRSGRTAEEIAYSYSLNADLIRRVLAYFER
jgi:uncharacterized protein (DUF433 family)